MHEKGPEKVRERASDIPLASYQADQQEFLKSYTLKGCARNVSKCQR